MCFLGWKKPQGKSDRHIIEVLEWMWWENLSLQAKQTVQISINLSKNEL